MAPLILHNVPDEELYVGDDGIQRPYALVFPQSVPLSFFPFAVQAHFSSSHCGLLTLDKHGFQAR